VEDTKQNISRYSAGNGRTVGINENWQFGFQISNLQIGISNWDLKTTNGEFDALHKH
jgi:hypothetical protein